MGVNKKNWVQAILMAGILLSMIFISGCGCTGDDSWWCIIARSIAKQTTTRREVRSYQVIAVEKGDWTICQKATHPSVCIRAVARSKRDPSICAHVPDSSEKVNCYSELSSFETAEDKKKVLIDTCKDISKISERYDCFTEVAVKTKDDSICVDYFLSGVGRDKCYSAVAKEKGE